MKVTIKEDRLIGRLSKEHPTVHVVGEQSDPHDFALCGQGALTIALGGKLIQFPAEGDCSQLNVRGEGPLCPKCAKTLQALERAKHPAPKDETRHAPPPVINAVEKIAELKAEYLAGKITFSQYEKKAHFWDHAAREAGLLGAPLPSDLELVGQKHLPPEGEPVRATGEPDEVFNARVAEWREGAGNQEAR